MSNRFVARGTYAGAEWTIDQGETGPAHWTVRRGGNSVSNSARGVIEAWESVKVVAQRTDETGTYNLGGI